MKGKKVKIVEMRDNIIVDCNIFNKGTLLSKLSEYGVEVYTGHKVVEITKDGLIANNGEENVLIKGDTVITAFGTKPRRAEAEVLRANKPNYHIVGDCDRVGNIHKAVYAVFGAGFSIE